MAALSVSEDALRSAVSRLESENRQMRETMAQALQKQHEYQVGRGSDAGRRALHWSRGPAG